MSGAIERYSNNRTPPRPPEVSTGTAPPGRSEPVRVAVFTGARTGRRYTGRIKNRDGSLGADIQWVFALGEDPGVETIIEANDLVEVIKAPAWLAADEAFGAVGTYGERYSARPPLWAVFG